MQRSSRLFSLRFSAHAGIKWNCIETVVFDWLLYIARWPSLKSSSSD